MNNFFLPIATVAGLMAIAAGVGCSDNATQTTEDDATEPADGGKTTPPQKTPPSASPQNGDDGGSADPSATTCMDTKPFDVTAVPYHPPAVKAGACTSTDVSALTDYLGKNPQASVQDLQTTLKNSKTCSDCVFGEAADEKWAAIVLDTTSATLNGGGCVSVVSGKDACGKAYQQWNTCLNEVCVACTGQSESAQCKNDAQQTGGPCGVASKALGDECGKDVNAYLTTCFGNGNAVGIVVEQLCGAPAKDGGS